MASRAHGTRTESPMMCFLPSQGSFTCECNAPWWLEVENHTFPGVLCSPIGPCEKGTDTCGLNHTCESTSDLDFNCTCNTGFYGNKVNFPPLLLDIFPVAWISDTSPSLTLPLSFSLSLCWILVCTLPLTWPLFLQSICFDLDECTTCVDDCDYNAVCNNTFGSFTCECQNGWEGDGIYCTDVCTTGNNSCIANASCVMNVDSATVSAQKRIQNACVHACVRALE